MLMLIRDHEVVGSNPVASTILALRNFSQSFFFVYCIVNFEG